MASGNFRLNKLNDVYGTDVEREKTVHKIAILSFYFACQLLQTVTMY